MLEALQKCETSKLFGIVLLSYYLVGCATSDKVYEYHERKISSSEYTVSVGASSIDMAQQTIQDMAEKLVTTHNCTSFKVRELEEGNQSVPINNSKFSPLAYVGSPFLRGYAEGQALGPQTMDVEVVRAQVNLIGCKSD